MATRVARTKKVEKTNLRDRIVSAGGGKGLRKWGNLHKPLIANTLPDYGRGGGPLKNQGLNP